MDGRDFENRKVIVFGASSGIGRACAIELGERGAKVVLVGRNQKRLEETAGRIPEGRSLILSCDVTDFDAAGAVVRDAVELDGVKLDGCVFSAGIARVIPAAAIREKAMLEVFQTNLFSLYAIGRAFSSRRISRDGASFVSLSSYAAVQPEKGQSIYAATKAAVNAYTSVAAQEWAPRRIRVNTVCPSMVYTPMTYEFFESLSQEQSAKTYPLGSLTVEDIAGSVLFLLSDASRKITGQAIVITAGYTSSKADSNQ